MENQNIIKSSLVYKARDFAINAHAEKNQKYGDFPYQKHLFDVVLNLTNHNYISPEYFITAFLHDVLEDCEFILPCDIESRFGSQILTNVIALSKLPNGKPNYLLLNSNPVAKAVKIADTISNLGQGLVEKNDKSAKYVNLFLEFQYELYKKGEHESLWKALKERISVYKLFVLDTPKLIAV